MAEEEKKSEKSLFISFNEICTKETTFQCTAIETKASKHTIDIESAKNLVCTELYHAGNRMTAVCSLPNSHEFFALIQRRDTSTELDEVRIQQYRLNMKNAQRNEFEIVFVKHIGTIFKDEGLCAEGIALVVNDQNDKDDDEKQKESPDPYRGFLIVNDVWCKPQKNSNLYFVDNSMNTRILASLNDGGAAELNDICYLRAFGKDGYLILPQSLCLGYLDETGNPNWSLFEKWMVSNDGEAAVLFVERRDVLKAIEAGDDKNNNKSGNLEMHKIRVRLEENYKSDESVFTKFGSKDTNGYIVEGFEAIAVNGQNNILLILECSIKEDTFNFIMTARFAQQGKDDELVIYIDPCKYKKIENNGGGNNHAQEALWSVP